MNEDKKTEPQEINEDITADVLLKKSRSFYARQEEPQENEAPAEPEKTDEKAEKKKEKKENKKQAKLRRRETKAKKYPDKLSFLLGLVIFIFAVIGMVLLVWNSVTYIKSTIDTGSEFADYNEYLKPIVAVDPDTFDDITAADQKQLLNAAIWSILSADATPDTYSYSGGYLLIPAKDVESAYVSIFGPETAKSITHATVQGYNCVFEYDSTGTVYKIPVTTISPIYTPQVTKVEKSGTALVVTVNYLVAESWYQDAEGNFVTPEPDKVMQITLHELQGSYYINSIRTVSSTVPETITFEMTTITEDSSEPVSQIVPETIPETTTAKTPEKTTLGGRV